MGFWKTVFLDFWWFLEDEEEESDSELKDSSEDEESEADSDRSEGASKIQKANEVEHTVKQSVSDEYEDHDTSDEEDIRNTVGNVPKEW